MSACRRPRRARFDIIAGTFIVKSRRNRGRYRHRRTEQGARPSCRTSHISHSRRPGLEGRCLRRRALQRERDAARLQGFPVGVNRKACAKFKKALDKLLPTEWSEPIYTENVADKVDRPLVAELQVDEQREADVRLLFNKADGDPKILIVTDKLLTG
jgi:hypothetical protein